MTSLIGPNGAGKSSTIRAIIGAIPSSGTVSLDGAKHSGRGAHRRVQRGTSYVPDGRGVFPDMTAKEHIKLAVGRRDWQQRWDFLIDLFPIIGEKQQWLSIARALAPVAKHVLLDEPSIGLSPVAIQGRRRGWWRSWRSPGWAYCSPSRTPRSRSGSVGRCT